VQDTQYKVRNRAKGTLIIRKAGILLIVKLTFSTSRSSMQHEEAFCNKPCSIFESAMMAIYGIS